MMNGFILQENTSILISRNGKTLYSILHRSLDLTSEVKEESNVNTKDYLKTLLFNINFRRLCIMTIKFNKSEKFINAKKHLLRH